MAHGADGTRLIRENHGSTNQLHGAGMADSQGNRNARSSKKNGSKNLAKGIRSSVIVLRGQMTDEAPSTFRGDGISRRHGEDHCDIQLET